MPRTHDGAAEPEHRPVGRDDTELRQQINPEEIAACELDPTIPAQEEASNSAFNTAHNLHGQTLIAYALRDA